MISIAVLPGDGIGPEVMAQALRILDYLTEHSYIRARYTTALVGGAALDATNSPLPRDTLSLCERSDAILFGSVGGPQWESLPPHLQPERGALLPLRNHFSLYANLRPILLPSQLAHLSPIQSHNLPDNLDILMVRELIGGIYFSTPKQLEPEYGLDTLTYTRAQVEKIATLAFRIARTRKKKLTSIDKANVLSSMVFWRNTVETIAANYPDVTLTHLYVDNAAMQLIVNPGQFDVVLCPNMFGDILSDEASVICGSLGMLPSASLSSHKTISESPVSGASKEEKTFGLFEPAGGSAPDIAGKNIANPIAQIRSLALLLRHSALRPDLADAIDNAVTHTLIAGYRTNDIYRSSPTNTKPTVQNPTSNKESPSHTHTTATPSPTKETLVSTEKMGSLILHTLAGTIDTFVSH